MRKIGISMAMLFLLAGCDRESPTPVAPSPVEATTPDVGTPSSSKAVVLADDYTPTFALQVRSQRHEAAGAKFRHVVITEYIDMDAPAVVAAIQSDLSDRGFAVAEPVAHGDAIRLIGKKGSLQIFADVHESPAVALQADNARGIVSFSWVDGEPR